VSGWVSSFGIGPSHRHIPAPQFMSSHRTGSDWRVVRLVYQPPASSTFLSNKRTSNQSVVLFSQNKLAPATSQTNMPLTKISLYESFLQCWRWPEQLIAKITWPVHTSLSFIFMYTQFIYRKLKGILIVHTYIMVERYFFGSTPPSICLDTWCEEVSNPTNFLNYIVWSLSGLWQSHKRIAPPLYSKAFSLLPT
jgi:hypothetical protein